MKFFTTVQSFINNLDSKQFNRYLIGLLSFCLLITIGLIINFYFQISYYTEELEVLNEARKNKVKELITTYKQLEGQKNTVKKILAEDPDFILRAHVEKLLAQLSLPTGQIQDVSRAELNDSEYQEVILKAVIPGISMKQLCELLKEIENSKRIYPKELEIAQVKPGSINIQLTIGTLQPKMETPI